MDTNFQLIKNLMLNGLIIYQDGTEFCIKKIDVPKNQMKIVNGERFSNFDSAFEVACYLLEQQEANKSWTPMVRYNQGLGIEYKNLHEIMAPNKEVALQLATEAAHQHFRNMPAVVIQEIKVKMNLNNS